MYEGDRDRSLTHCRRDPLDVTGAHVTDREHSGQTRFEKMRNRERPMRDGQVVLQEIWSRLNAVLLSGYGLIYLNVISTHRYQWKLTWNSSLFGQCLG